MLVWIAVAGMAGGAGRAQAQAPSTPALYDVPTGVGTRWASPENPTGARGQAGRAGGGRKGAPTITLKAGQSAVLAEAHGTSGTVRRIWMTLLDPSRPPCCSARVLRSLRIDMYWDGAATPAVSAPLGDFFGVGLGRTAAFESALFSSPEGRSFNATVPMPFRTGMRLVLTNEGDVDIPAVYYDVDYTLGDQHPASAAYFHAYWRRERPTRPRADYEILPRVTGRGRYLGANLGVIVDQAQYFGTWWGEGEVKVYLDGDSTLATLAGTGTEDYIGTGFGEGRFAHLYQGAPVADTAAGRFAFYRYHIPDPVYFGRDVRVTIQQIGFHMEAMDHSSASLVRAGRRLARAGAGGTALDLREVGLFERADDWSSCVYFYLDRPENGLPALAPVAVRLAGL
ncbi:MAG TPA: glycoside hydrolase family 172 protein [Gemmatirosa sp.]